MAITRLNNNSITSITALPSAAKLDTNDVVLLKTVTVSSSVSSVEFKNGVDDVVFDSTYKVYKIFGSNVDCTTSGDEIIAQISNDTGSTYKTSGYRGQALNYYWNGSAAGNAQHTFTNGIEVCRNVDSATTETAYFELTINEPNVSNLQTLYSQASHRDFQTTANTYLYISSCFYNDANIVVDAIRIIASSGNIDGGVFKLYGYK